MTTSDISMRLRGSVQRARLGEIDHRMVAVTCGVEGAVIRLRSYVDGLVETDDIERIRRISTQVIADFVDDGFTVAEECVSLRSDEPRMLDFWAFYRAGK